MPLPDAPDPARKPDDHFLISFDGTPIHFWYWPATPASPHATTPQAPPSQPKLPVLIVHGAGEYGERYRPFAESLNRAGYPAAAIDLRGFGQSGGPRAHVDRFSDYIADIEAVAAQVMRLSAAPSLHLFGHSMGGLAAASAAAEARPASIASLTLSSPCFALSFPVAAHLRAIGWACSTLAPRKLFATRAISELLTHDAEIARQHREDPRITHFMSARLFFEMHRQMGGYRRLARGIDVPTAVFQAGDDRVVDRAAAHDFFQTLSRKDKRWTLYPEYFHEILNEVSREQVRRDILAFLDSI